MARVWNFAAGPGILPESVLKQVAQDFVDYKGTGMSLVEMSHRGKIFGEIVAETESLIRELLAVPESHAVLFLQGGGHTQFSMVPLNLMGEKATATYLVNGTWSKKAAAEAAKFGAVHVVKPQEGRSLPDASAALSGSSYLYYCQNETVNGIEYHTIPQTDGDTVLVADVSSNFLSRPIDFEKHGLVFAGAQKNFAPAGLTVAIVRRDLMGHVPASCPVMLDYAIHAKGGSMYNTPPVFQIWVAQLVARWIKDEGGVAAMSERADKRSALLYEAIDQSGGFYRSPVEKSARSRMNVVFTMPDEALTDLFVSEARAACIENIRGHRSVGGMRASIYNAMPMQGVQALAHLMKDFAARHG